MYVQTYIRLCLISSVEYNYMYVYVLRILYFTLVPNYLSRKKKLKLWANSVAYSYSSSLLLFFSSSFMFI